jgi:tetratricopeptide (TPR) repeat protein
VSAVRLLGGQKYSWLSEIGSTSVPGCSWHVARRESDGARFVVQLWDPRPTDKALDKIKESFLSGFADAEAMDPPAIGFGFDENQAWFIQMLLGTPVSKAWPSWTRERRRSFQAHIMATLGGARHPRFLAPEALGLLPGRTLMPRVIGPEPWGFEGLLELLPEEQEGEDPDPLPPWEQPRDFPQGLAHPIRGRGQEMTYLKSLMFGLTAPTPMERIIVLQGEEGLGKERLALWSAAAAETDGLWVHHLETQHAESPGSLFNRILQNLLTGYEAEFYSHRPDLARGLSRRLESFGFLAGGRPPKDKDATVTGEEMEAALEVMEFATGIHPRLLYLSVLERADIEGLALVARLAQRSRLPWLVTFSAGAQAARSRAFLSPLKDEPALAVVHLNRLEDEDLRQILLDILGAHELPERFLKDLLRSSLGNPGLMHSFLELAIQAGELVWVQGSWRLSKTQPTELRAPEDHMRQVLLGRLQRLRPAAAVLVRMLAITDQNLPVPILGSALGLAGEPLEEAVQNALSSRLVHVQDGRAAMMDPQMKELVLEHTPLPELKRLARALLGSLRQEGGSAVLSVRLQSLASDEATALAQVMRVIDQGTLLNAAEAERVVQQALDLQPAPVQAARLCEFLSDCLAMGGEAVVLLPDQEAMSAPWQRSLDALETGLAAIARGPLDPILCNAKARMLRKKAFIELRRRRTREALASLTAAGECLADHPLHPEQPLLRLALGKLHLVEGHYAKGIRALEEGLQLLGQATQKGDHKDHVALLVELGRALVNHCQFQRAASMLQSAQRLLEHDQDFRNLVSVHTFLGNLFLIQGQPEAAHTLFREALRIARVHGDTAVQAEAHLALGIFRSNQQLLGPALSHLDRALERFNQIGDSGLVIQATIWKARTLAALGDVIQADHLILQALAQPQEGLSAIERGDHAFLEGEVSWFQSTWREAANRYAQAGVIFGEAGLLWRERLARLKHVQAQALHSEGGGLAALEPCWAQLEILKGPVEGSGSRWLELEWNRAHALLLNHAAAQEGETAAAEALSAWGEVLAAARELRFPAVVMEACAQIAELLVRRGEKLGARSRMQDAFQSFQELWTWIPESHESLFLGRPHMHRFRQAVETSGLRFVLPERADPLTDWTPTQANLPTLQLHLPLESP